MLGCRRYMMMSAPLRKIRSRHRCALFKQTLPLFTVSTPASNQASPDVSAQETPHVDPSFSHKPKHAPVYPDNPSAADDPASSRFSRLMRGSSSFQQYYTPPPRVTYSGVLVHGHTRRGTLVVVDTTVSPPRVSTDWRAAPGLYGIALHDADCDTCVGNVEVLVSGEEEVPVQGHFLRGDAIGPTRIDDNDATAAGFAPMTQWGQSKYGRLNHLRGFGFQYERSLQPLVGTVLGSVVPTSSTEAPPSASSSASSSSSARRRPQWLDAEAFHRDRLSGPAATHVLVSLPAWAFRDPTFETGIQRSAMLGYRAEPSTVFQLGRFCSILLCCWDICLGGAMVLMCGSVALVSRLHAQVDRSFLFATGFAIGGLTATVGLVVALCIYELCMDEPISGSPLFGCESAAPLGLLLVGLLITVPVAMRGIVVGKHMNHALRDARIPAGLVGRPFVGAAP
eukprot:TRINITY_DN2754_c1_g1_i2.p1 TRINITY_DN2754_c1_g1~~TRINITY_DN2754_c1_g1_i2.p1  ORF type:complete len:452 (+),score=64.72 TRINITY_DN2754_c1_g1_i2:143-1498(+)